MEISVRFICGITISIFFLYILIQQMYIRLYQREDVIDSDIITDYNKQVHEVGNRSGRENAEKVKTKERKNEQKLKQELNMHLHPLCSLISTTDIEQRMYINEIKEYDGWKCRDGIPINDVCSQWSGVTCDKKSYITSVEIPNLSITGDISIFVKSIPTLELLDIRGNNFHGVIDKKGFIMKEASKDVNTLWV